MWTQEKLERVVELKKQALLKAEEKLASTQAWLDASIHMQSKDTLIGTWVTHLKNQDEVKELQIQLKVLTAILDNE